MLPGAYRRPRRKKGRYYIYWYAWRGAEAPQIASFVGASWAEVEAKERAAAPDIAARYSNVRKPLQNPGFMSSLLADFERLELPKTATTTQRVWRGHLREIKETFGDTSLKAMQQRGARQLIKRWHEGEAKWNAELKVYTQPRTANIRLTVLARALSWGVDEERLEKNAAAGIDRLAEGPGRAHIVWTPAELSAFLKHCKPQVARAVRLASLTGLRLADVVALNWSEIEDDVIRRPTSKSRRKQRASIPIYPALRTLLAECPKHGPKVITNSRKHPWKDADSFDSSMRPAIVAYRAAGGVAKHFHDLRGTAATLMYAGGLTARQIALALGWSESEVDRRVNDYVDLDAIARAMAAGRTT